MGGKEGAKRGGFVFDRKRKRKWKKYALPFVKNLSRIPKLFFLFLHKNWWSSIFLYIYFYIYIYVYIYIYIKLSPKWKNFQEQKVFLFRFYILCDNFSKIGPIIKKWGAKGVYRWVQILLFSMFIFIIYSSIYLIHSYFQILLVCEEC